MADNSTFNHRDGAARILGHESAHAGNQSFLDRIISMMRNAFIKYRPLTQTAMMTETTTGLYRLSPATGQTAPEGSFDARGVSEAINGFSESCRTAFTMYLTGYRYSEIARSMRLPLSTVKNRVAQARRQLQSAMPAY